MEPSGDRSRTPFRHRRRKRRHHHRRVRELRHCCSDDEESERAGVARFVLRERPRSLSTSRTPARGRRQSSNDVNPSGKAEEMESTSPASERLRPPRRKPRGRDNSKHKRERSTSQEKESAPTGENPRGSRHNRENTRKETSRSRCSSSEEARKEHCGGRAVESEVEQHTPMREAPRGAHPTSPHDESVDYGDSDSNSGKEQPTMADPHGAAQSGSPELQAPTRANPRGVRSQSLDSKHGIKSNEVEEPTSGSTRGRVGVEATHSDEMEEILVEPSSSHKQPAADVRDQKGYPITIRCPECGKIIKGHAGNNAALVQHQNTNSACLRVQGRLLHAKQACPNNCGKMLPYNDAWALEQHLWNCRRARNAWRHRGW